jgi:L-ascorbate metabolism protein UlaG (beta-lactamase superfamily)
MPVTLRWYPNSFFLASDGRRTIAFDPGRLDESVTLPKTDLILVTHHHPDHINKRLVAELSGEETMVVGTVKTRRKLGPQRIIVQPGDDIEAQGLRIKAVHAYNPPGSRLIRTHRKGDCVGYVIDFAGKTIYHAGDTGVIDEMKDLGPIDIALLPIGGGFTMDIDEAVEAVKIIKPHDVIPMYMRGADPMRFKARAESETVSRVTVLAPGEAKTFS